MPNINFTIKSPFTNHDKSTPRFCCQEAAKSQICFETYLVKSHILLITRQPLSQRKNEHIFGILKILMDV
jgi:hypothetical protein